MVDVRDGNAVDVEAILDRTAATDGKVVRIVRDLCGARKRHQDPADVVRRTGRSPDLLCVEADGHGLHGLLRSEIAAGDGHLLRDHCPLMEFSLDRRCFSGGHEHIGPDEGIVSNEPELQGIRAGGESGRLNPPFSSVLAPDWVPIDENRNAREPVSGFFVKHGPFDTSRRGLRGGERCGEQQNGETKRNIVLLRDCVCEK